MWTATEYGLNRFDGLHFTGYWHQTDDSTSIKNNYVRTLFEDSRQNLLVGCIDGLMKYDRELDSFCEIPMMRAGRQVFPHVTQMRKLGNGEIWISTTGQGMFRLDEQRMQAFSLDDVLKQANYNYQSCFYEDSGGTIWIALTARESSATLLRRERRVSLNIRQSTITMFMPFRKTGMTICL